MAPSVGQAHRHDTQRRRAASDLIRRSTLRPEPIIDNTGKNFRREPLPQDIPMTNNALASIDFQSKALELQAERGRVLASNIANADTPNYKARDFDFQQALAAAVQGTGSAAGPVTPVRTDPGHLAGPAGSGTTPPLLYRAPLQSAVDGNTVDLDVERAGFAENSVRYEATLKFLNAQIKQMMTAINGQ